MDLRSSPCAQVPFAAAILLLGACATAPAKPPSSRVALEANRHVLPSPAPVPVRAFASDDVVRRTNFASRPVLNDAWHHAHESPRAYPATFSTLPDLHSRAYLLDLSIPTMGGDGRGIRDQSPTEQFIRQVRKEGMPFARLWQNDQALLSLGLNRKGKPGLWIIQKTR